MEFQWEFMENIKEILFLSGLILGIIWGHALGVSDKKGKQLDKEFAVLLGRSK